MKETTLLQHLTNRHWNPEKHFAWLSPNQMTVPLFSFDRAMRGVQVYTPDAPKKDRNPKECRYFTRVFGGKQLVWGTEIIPKRDDRILN